MAQTDLTVLSLVNAIRNEASADYQNRIPAATRQNIAEVGNALLSYTAGKEMFFGELVNKIARTRLHVETFTNKFEKFRGEMLHTGDTLEDLFFEIIDAETFDGETTNPFAPVDKATRKELVGQQYHKVDRRDRYKLTVSDEQIRTAFKSQSGVNNFINSMIGTIENSVQFNNWIMFKNLIGAYDGYKQVQIPTIDLAAADKSELANQLKFLFHNIQQASKDIEYFDTKYNAIGHRTQTPKKKQVLIMNKDIMAAANIYLFADAFHPSRLMPGLEIMEVDDFGSDANGKYAVLVDEDCIVANYQLNQTESLRNPEGLFHNYWKHVWQLMSMRRFKNAISFAQDKDTNLTTPTNNNNNRTEAPPTV